MKLCFLDIDGVLNSSQSIRASFRRGLSGLPHEVFCPIACSNLQEVMARVPDLQIVVSSSWRIGRTLEQLKEDLKPTGIDMSRVIGMTPVVRLRGPRGREIHEWLVENHALDSTFVILDDDSDMSPHKSNLVQCDPSEGFMWNKAMEVLHRFGWKDDNWPRVLI